jgi:hypothetical protein
MSSATTPPSLSIRGRPCSTTAGRSTTSSTAPSTRRLRARRTSTRPTTGCNAYKRSDRLVRVRTAFRSCSCAASGSSIRAHRGRSESASGGAPAPLGNVPARATPATGRAHADSATVLIRNGSSWRLPRTPFIPSQWRGVALAGADNDRIRFAGDAFASLARTVGSAIVAKRRGTSLVPWMCP